MQNKGVIYKITCIINNKVYIGQTIQDYQMRFSQHKSHARTGLSNHKFARAIRKYGEDNFIIEVLEFCEYNQLDDRERYWISYYDSTNDMKGYNTKLGGQDKNNFYVLENQEDIIKYYYECHNQQKVCEKFNISEYKFRQLLAVNNLPTDYTNYGKHTAKAVYIYELDKYFNSEQECAKFLFENNYTKCKKIDSVIIRVSKNLLNFNKTYGLSIYPADMTYEEFMEKYFNYIRKYSNKKIVCKTDQNKNILQKYESVAAASADTMGGDIYNAVKSKSHYSKGYYWYYEDELK